MPTLVVKTIGTGGDYATPALWAAAGQLNLVTRDEVWEGRILAGNNFTDANMVVELSGATTDATRYRHLTANAGASIFDNAANPLYPNSSLGVTLTTTGSYDSGFAVKLNEPYARVSRLQLLGGPGSGTRNSAVQFMGANSMVDRCLVAAYCDSVASGVISTAAGSPVTLRNSLVLQLKGGAPCIIGASTGGTVNIENCTLAVPTGTTVASAAVRRSYNDFVVTNTAAFGVGAVSSGTAGSVTGSNNRTDAPAVSGFTNLAYASAGFTNTASDYRIGSSSPLKDAGTTIAAVTIDAYGTTRPQGANYDIGAFEYASGGGGDTTAPTLTGSITIGAVTSSSIQFSWPAGSDNVAVTGYEVSKDNGTTWVNAGNVLTYTFSSLTASTSYQLAVRAYDAVALKSTPPLTATQSTSAAAATAVTLTGPSSGFVGTASTAFTVGANGVITGTVTVTPSDGGAGGTFAPTSVGISSGSPTATFTYTAASAGAKSISATNNGGLTNPSTITFTASALPTLNFQAAGMEFGRRTGLGIGTFSLDAGSNYRYTVHADGLVLGSAVYTSGVVATDSNGKLPNLANGSLASGSTYRVIAVRQADGEAAVFRMVAA